MSLHAGVHDGSLFLCPITAKCSEPRNTAMRAKKIQVDYGATVVMEQYFLRIGSIVTLNTIYLSDAKTKLHTYCKVFNIQQQQK